MTREHARQMWLSASLTTLGSDNEGTPILQPTAVGHMAMGADIRLPVHLEDESHNNVADFLIRWGQAMRDE